MRTLLLLGLMVCATACAAPNSSAPAIAGSVWIVHATDPHLFVGVVTEKTADQDKRRIERQRALNEDALKDVLARVSTLIAVEGEPRALIVTGDFDADPCAIASVPDQTRNENREATIAKCVSDARRDDRDRQIKQLASILGSSPIRDVYVVPGHNDIARESAGDAALKYFNDFVADVQKSITTDQKKNVRVHNLVGCYAGGTDADCVSDVADTSYRLVSVPSYSFRNIDDAALAGNDASQLRQMQKFAALVDAGGAAGKKMLVVTHVPDIDDPQYLAQDRYAASPPSRPDTKVDGRSISFAWNVTKPVMDAWTRAVSSDAIAGVLAGHFHDSHREIYRQPYNWSPVDTFAEDRGKLFITPPLAINLQDTSPIQARGFSLIQLLPDRVQRRLYWYDAESSRFMTDAQMAFDPSAGFFSRLWAQPSSLVLWLWRLALPDKSITRLAVMLIAFLVAFLTVARVWRIPLEKNPFTTDSTTSATGSTGEAVFEASPFAGNFGKTVTAGLAGLVAESALKSVVSNPPQNDKEFYVIWFVLFFFAMLVAAAALQGMVEGLRARLAIVRFARVPPPQSDPKDKYGWLKNVLRSMKYRLRQFLEWCYSFRHPLVVFFDTLLNRIQGQNQALSYVFSKIIVDQQNTTVRVADTIRGQLNELLVRKLSDTYLASPPASTAVNPSDVRVNISVMSADQTSVFYIATARGSAPKLFPRRSVAWVSVFTGEIRWYKKTYRDDLAAFSNIVLFDNQSGTIEGDETTILLKSHYQPRNEDYQAFVVFPIPWPRRSANPEAVKGAIHISFRDFAHFEHFWTIGGAAGDPVMNKAAYDSANEVLDRWCNDPEVSAAISSAIKVLEPLLSGFNENIYKASKPV
jgi:hypothetical protein